MPNPQLWIPLAAEVPEWEPLFHLGLIAILVLVGVIAFWANRRESKPRKQVSTKPKCPKCNREGLESRILDREITITGTEHET